MSYLPAFPEVVRDNSSSIVGTGVSWLAVLTASQEQLEYRLRVASLCAALLASGFTIWGVWRKRNQ